MIAGADEQGRPRSLSGTTLNGQVISFAQVGGSSLAGPMWKKAMGVIQDHLPATGFETPPETEPHKGDSDTEDYEDPANLDAPDDIYTPDPSDSYNPF